MKIGILTVYFADYGSFAHATCLYNYIASLGHDVELINACIRYKHSPRLKVANIGTKILPNFMKQFIANHNSMYNNFLNLENDLNNYKISKPFKDINEITNSYDCVILGSDELWSCTNSNINYIPEYYGINVNCPMISYSTSGITLKDPAKNITNEMKLGLQKFKSIAVRDEITKKWLNEYCNIDAQIVLDPVFLNPFFVTEYKDVKDSYILIYGEHFSNTQEKVITDFSAKYKLPIKCVIWDHPWSNGTIDIKTFNDLENAFKGASYCITSTFHGTAFSIINHKPFTTFDSQLRGLKIKNLLYQLGLEERSYEINPSNCFNWRMDYNRIEEKLDELRENSNSYLNNALANISL